MGIKDFAEIIDVKSEDIPIKPLIVQFEYGKPNQEEIAKLSCDVKKSKENPKEITLSLKSENNVYIFKSLSSMYNSSELNDHYFVIRNKLTNKVRVVPVERVQVSRCLENVNVEIYDKDISFSKEINNTLPDNENDITNLKKVFGSKRSQRGLDVMSRLKINHEAISSKMEKTINDVDAADSSFIISNNDNVSSFLPKCHRDATDVTQVYKLEELFTSEKVMDSLTELAKSIMEHCPKIPDKEHSEFLINSLKQLSPATEDKVKCLIFADSIIKFLKVEIKKLNNKTVFYSVCPNSKVLRQVITAKFTVSNKAGMNRPLTMRDKAICYVLVLLTIAFDYKLNQEEQLKHLPKISLNKLNSLARAVGLVQAFGSKTWILKVPLPPLRTFKSKKKDKFA